jgi:hypothetical protein
MEKQKLEDREINYVKVGILTEMYDAEECDSYNLEILELIGSLNINLAGGLDDISLIKECIENNLEMIDLPEEGFTVILLKESGEWEDVFWNKYYEIISIFKHGLR